MRKNTRSYLRKRSLFFLLAHYQKLPLCHTLTEDFTEGFQALIPSVFVTNVFSKQAGVMIFSSFSLLGPPVHEQAKHRIWQVRSP